MCVDTASRRRNLLLYAHRCPIPRAILSDGVLFIQAMMATQLNPLVEAGEINKFTVICVQQFACNYVQTRKYVQSQMRARAQTLTNDGLLRLVICLRVDVLAQTTDKIGLPTGLETSGAAAPVAAPAPRAAPAPVPARAGASSSRGGKAGAPSSRSGGAAPPIYPIEGLSPYQNKSVPPSLHPSLAADSSLSDTGGRSKLVSPPSPRSRRGPIKKERESSSLSTCSMRPARSRPPDSIPRSITFTSF